MNQEGYPGSPLTLMLFERRPTELTPVVCSWSDLLGFGDQFRETGWNPTTEQWEAISHRLSQMYRMHCLNQVHLDNFLLILNDGVVSTSTFPQSEDPNTGLNKLSKWLRGVVQSHIWINYEEKSAGYPGARAVISAGVRASYSFGEARLDDLVLNSTRSTPGLSKVAEMLGNPLLVANPSPLQMNTAFSKAYIVESTGSKAGLDGPNLYIDMVLLDFIEELAGKSGGLLRVIEEEREDGNLIAVPYSQDYPSTPWYFGCLLDKQKLEVKARNYSTHAAKLLKFFPHDENPATFWFDLVNPPDIPAAGALDPKTFRYQRS